MATTLKNESLFRSVIILLLLFCISLNIEATSYTIQLKDSSGLSENALTNLSSIMDKLEAIWGAAADIDIEQVRSADTILCSFNNEQLSLYLQNHNIIDDYYSAHYKSNGEDIADVSILDASIRIDLRTISNKYLISSISEKEVAVVLYEPKILDEPEYNELVKDELNYGEALNIESVVPTTTPTVRVMFLFTSSALMMMTYPQQTYMKMEAYRYINEGNQSFVNSNINAHLELAYLGFTDYNESSYSWDEVLNHFYTQGDGYMDEVHTLRNKYKADICVLMVNKSVGLCGKAKTISADAGTAFCVIWPSFSHCGWRYTAIHEIGHLVGCRHNITKDSTNTPYQYGHGFIHCNTTNPSASWCTIMSYESSCSADPNRILNWSNPNIYYNGIATGTAKYENNARVWNERASTVSTFRSKDNYITLTTYDNNTTSLFESYEANSEIVTGAGYEIQSGQIVDMTAANQIRLLPNTHIKSGSNFRASIRNNADGGTYPQFIKAQQTQNENATLEHSFSIAPNPVKDILTVATTEQIEQVRIYNLNGQCMLQCAETEINVSSLSSGIYLLYAITADAATHTQKFIKR